jgi:hypothetical protein
MSNPIAVVLESHSSIMPDGNNRQTIMFHNNGEVVLFSRTADGKQGQSNRWEPVSYDNLIGTFHDDEVLTRPVTGVEVTLSDMTKYAETSRIQVLGVKAVSALLKSDKLPLDSGYSVHEAFILKYEDVVANESSLVELVGKVSHLVPQQTTPTTGENMSSNLGQVINVALATIPRPEIGERYINRKVQGNLFDFEVFDYARKTATNVLIYGPTGPGKTTSVEAWSAIRGLRLATVSGSAALEPSQMIGKYVSDGAGGFAWIDGPITDVVRNGGVLILDELNFINMKIITPLYSLLDARRSLTLLDHHGETIQAHPDLTIFATMNPNYIGTAPLNFAFRNRFDIQIPWDYDYDVESKLVDSKNLLELAKQLRSEADKGMYETPIATNMLMEFEKFARDLNYEFAMENFIAHFSDEEQASIRLVFQTYEYNLKDDLGINDMTIVTEHPEQTLNVPTN